jgi:hypothetical protein
VRIVKAIGLTNTQFLIAVIIGLLLSLVWVAATAPHPVSVPVQVITPVPTPAPVIVGSTPATTVVYTGGGDWIYGMLALFILVGTIAAAFWLLLQPKNVPEREMTSLQTAMTRHLEEMNGSASVMMFAMVVAGVIVAVVMGIYLLSKVIFK